MSRDKVLYAYYDLNLSPISFDFVVFAINAEVIRRRLQYSAIHFIIVPGTAGGFRADDSEYDLDNKLWRLSNIVTPICRLMPCPPSVSTCQTREEAKRITSGIRETYFLKGILMNRSLVSDGPKSSHKGSVARPHHLCVLEAKRYLICMSGSTLMLPDASPYLFPCAKAAIYHRETATSMLGYASPS